jgi:hypothetical protein
MGVDRVKYLEMIQTIVTRMAGNSFLVKGWTVTIVAALVALAAKEAETRFALVALLPTLSFWGSDAYYLRYERLFRRLYDDVRVAAEDKLVNDPYSLSTELYVKECPSWFRTLWTAHVVALHGVLIAALIAVVVLLMLARQRVSGDLGPYS